jgi:serine/threonine protein kinase
VIKQFLPLQQGTGNRERASALFRQEALRLQELGHHAQMPALLGALEQAEQQYLVQTFIDGPNLAQALADEGAWSEAQILQLLDELLPILEFTHAHQVIHRDSKPANIIRQTADQTLFLVDLGAAKYATGTALAQTGTVIGSAEYTAPEQARGKAVFVSDIYSLGVTCIHLLTEMSPFDLFDNANGRWVWRTYLKEPLTNLQLGRILDKILQAATNQRYQSIQALQLDLAALHSPEQRFLRSLPSEQASVDQLSRAAQSEAAVQARHPVPQRRVEPSGAVRSSQSAASERSLTGIQTVGLIGLLALALIPYTVWALWGERPASQFSTAKPSPPAALVPPRSRGTLPNLRPQFTQLVSPVRTLRVDRGLTSLALSPKGSFLASGSLGAIHLWQLGDRNWNRTLLTPEVWIGAVAISPDGRILVSTTDKGEIQLRDLPSGNLLRSLNDLTKAIAISPDGQTLASGSSGPDTVYQVMASSQRYFKPDATGASRDCFSGCL